MSTSYDYVIIGAGVAAAKAVEGIRDVDDSGSILVLGAEPDPPVYRPVLSKDLWLKDDAALEDETLLDGTTEGVELRLESEAAGIDTASRTVTLADGSSVEYGALLLATGAEPRTLGLPAGPRVLAYRTAADYRQLRDLLGPDTHAVVVGGGYIGAEMAAALVQNDVRVTMVLPEDLVQERLFPQRLAQRMTTALADHGVEIVHGLLEGGDSREDGVTVRLEDGTTIEADLAVVGVGVTPRTALAEAAGIEVDDGIVVDASLRTSAEHVYAAGDVASYPDARLGRRRVEHVDHAEKSGELAGRAMAGSDATYGETPFFWSDLFDDGYEAIGELSTALDVVEDWQGDDDPTDRGVVYYLEGGRVRGVLLWNVWDSVDAARALLEATQDQPLDDPSSLRGRITG
jgi:3-phenylpropionate/trans-cinnamate dioxygenase ferredoxin reductase component